MKARHRKSGSSPRSAAALPRLWLVTDARVGQAALLAATRALPRGSGVLFRHRGAPGRRTLFNAVRRIARGRRLMLILADRPDRAAAWGADGFHDRNRPGPARLIHTAPVHDPAEIHRARTNGADMLFLSPVFPTRSHPESRALGLLRFAAMARRAGKPVIALGGMTPARWRRLRTGGAHGWAAIDALTPDAITPEALGASG